MKAIPAILCVVIITSTFASPIQAQSFLTNGLVAYYPLNGTANDASGNGNDGVVVGATPAIDRFGNPNGCYSFNGVGQYIVAPADNMPTDQRTISVWFNANEADTEPQFLGYGGNGCGTAFWMGLNVAHRTCFDVSTHCGYDELLVPYGAPPTNAWYHFVAVRDNVGISLYINGQLIGSEVGTTETYVAGTQLGIGVISGPSGGVPYTDANVGYMNGFLDDIRIYNRPLSASEVQELYDYDSQPIESVVWTNPAPITYGTALSSTQLDAVANVAGSFEYFPTNGTVLNPGTNVLSAIFTPTDRVVYSTATNTVALVVYPPAPNISIPKAVYLTSTNLFVGFNYQVQASTDFVNWTNQGSPFTATNSIWRSPNFWDVNDWSQFFFRLQPVQ